MRLTCPICGDRDRREFYYRGAVLERPGAEASGDAWQAYVHERENPAGVVREHWCHAGGCGAWLEVERDTVSHVVHAVRLAGEGA
jgi:sarcosine oxidase subunit delta